MIRLQTSDEQWRPLAQTLAWALRTDTNLKPLKPGHRHWHRDLNAGASICLSTDTWHRRLTRHGAQFHALEQGTDTGTRQ
jgi:hypothetical protein